MGWVDTYFDNTYWQNGGEYWQCQWDGTKWVSGIYSYNVDIFTIGTWADGFRPTKAKVYHDKSPNVPQVILRSSVELETVGSAVNYVSGSEINLSYPLGANFSSLYVATGDDYSAVTGISFYVEDTMIVQPIIWVCM